MAGDTSHIIRSLIANTSIAIAKGTAAVFTGSGAMLAETLHSVSDCGNQLLLLLGVKRAQRPPTASHPLGYGRVLYFWSFMVALLLFSGGGAFSIYEGAHKLESSEPVERVWLGLVILGVSLVVEAWALIGAVRVMNQRRAGKPVLRYIRDSKDSDLVVVLGEDLAAVLGLAVAMAALVVADQTGDGRWDAMGSMGIGVVLILVAVFLAVEVKSLLVGESADPEVEATARAVVAEDPRLTDVLECITVQQGPGEVLVALKIRFAPHLTADQVSHAINDFEKRLRERERSIRWCFVEPDLPQPSTSA